MKIRKRISTPEKLNSYLHATSPVTWISLGLVIFCLLGLIIWAFLATITYKLTGNVLVNDGKATLEIAENRKQELKIGQEIYIGKSKGKIIEIGSDGNPIVQFEDLEDGNYQYVLILKTIHPIEYFANR